MTADLEILRAGLFTTIQDKGRMGYLKYGVPLSGAMDQYSAKTANILLQNPVDAPVMEITLSGPKLRFSEPSEVVITGADLSPELNGKPAESNVRLQVNPGDVLSFGTRKNGYRSYLGIAGGFRTEKILGSCSWFEGITAHHRLEKGMKLSYQVSGGKQHDMHASLRILADHILSDEVAVTPGPEFYLLSRKERSTLSSRSFTVDQNNNRMAVQLTETLDNTLDPIITGPVVPGTVQLTPSGKLIVLMRDCQTTGGYPRVLQLSEGGINTLSQKLPGDRIGFVLG